MNAHSKIAMRRQTNLEDSPTIFVELNILSSTEDRCPFGLLSVPGHYYFHQYCAVLLQEGQVTSPVSLYSWKRPIHISFIRIGMRTINFVRIGMRNHYDLGYVLRLTYFSNNQVRRT